MHAGDVLWDEWAERAERAVQRDVLLQWGSGDCDAGGRGDGRGMSGGTLLPDGERCGGGVPSWDVCEWEWEWECWGVCELRCGAVLCDDWSECADRGVSCGALVCGRDGGAERAVSARVLVSCRGGGAAGLCERDVPGPGWAVGVQGVSGWVVL